MMLAYNQFSTHLQTAYFQQVTGSMGMWTHPITIFFCLCVDEFGLRYFKQQYAQEFLNHLGTKYKHTMD